MNRRQVLASVAGLTGLGSFAAFPTEVPPPVPDWKDTRIEKLSEGLIDLSKVTAAACSDGNWDYDAYMHGMANGLILALHIMEGQEGTPDYKAPPKRWLWSKGHTTKTLGELYPGTGSS